MKGRTKTGAVKKSTALGKGLGTRGDNVSISGNIAEPQKRGSNWKPMEETEDMMLRELKTEKERMKARNEMIIKRDFT